MAEQARETETLENDLAVFSACVEIPVDAGNSGLTWHLLKPISGQGLFIHALLKPKHARNVIRNILLCLGQTAMQANKSAAAGIAVEATPQEASQPLKLNSQLAVIGAGTAELCCATRMQQVAFRVRLFGKGRARQAA